MPATPRTETPVSTSGAEIAGSPLETAVQPLRPPPVGRPSGAKTKARIRGVASELFFEQGYHATSMRQIADGAGVRVGSLYNHFTNKEDLLFRIAYETMEEMIARANDATVHRAEDTAPPPPF